MISSSHQSGSHKHRSCSIGNPFFTCCQRECLQAVPNLVRTVEILGAKSNRFKVRAKEHDFVNVSNVHILEHVARVTCSICISQTVGSPPPPQLLTTPDSRFRRLDPKQLPSSGQHPTCFANATQSYLKKHNNCMPSKCVQIRKPCHQVNVTNAIKRLLFGKMLWSEIERRMKTSRENKASFSNVIKTFGTDSSH